MDIMYPTTREHCGMGRGESELVGLRLLGRMGENIEDGNCT
jgi:hypothetical protein